jgi:hypothetical protein
MRTVLLTLPFVLVANAAFAQASPNSLTMSCSAARATVQQGGAVVMYSGPDIFDRFVSNVSYCEGNEWTVPAWIPTEDNPHCLVGKRCKEIELNSR